MLEIAHRFFSSTLRNLTLGTSFQGQLLQIPVSETASNFLTARRFLKLDADSTTVGGHVIQTVSGQRYLAADRGVAELQDTLIFKTLRLYQVTDLSTIFVPKIVTDDILGKAVTSGDPDKRLTQVSCTIEPTILEPDGMKTQVQVVRIITNVKLAPGYVVDNKYKITTVNDEGGLYFCTADTL